MFDCYLNGEILPFDECRLHISDMQIQRGYGVFDFFRCYAGHIPFLEDYSERLFRSIGLSGIECPMTPEDLEGVIQNLLQRNPDGESAFKVMVTGGYSADLARASGSGNVLILHLPSKAPDPVLSREGVKLISTGYTRPEPEIKTLNYFSSVRLHREMQRMGAVDVLYHSDVITETSRANVFFVREGEIFTTKNNILPGVTRKKVLGMFPGIRFMDLPFTQLYEVDEMFMTSTTMEVVPVVAVDGRKIGTGKPGKATRKVQDAFRDLLTQSAV